MPLVVETLKVTVFSGIFPGRSSGINKKKTFKINFLGGIYWSRFATDLNANSKTVCLHHIYLLKKT